ncbi:MAG: EAL domain-containing protein [Burkholderiales bacterium]|nr:EAL domain-containing protein [Burkholderiales bacterium]
MGGTSKTRLLALDTVHATILLALVYVIAGRLALSLALPPGYASAFFPPAGIALAAVVAGGRRMLIGVALGSFVLNLSLSLQQGMAIPLNAVLAPAAIACGSTLQAWIGSQMFQRWLRPALDTGRDVLLFLMGAPLMSLVAASLAIPVLYFCGLISSDMAFINWVTWWVGDAIGVLLGAPLTWIIIGEPRRLWRRRRWLLSLPLIASSGAFIAIYAMVSHWEAEQHMLGFRMKAQQVADTLQNQFSEHERVLHTLANMIGQRGAALSSDEFASVARGYLEQRPELRSMYWLPRVPGETRTEFEQWAQQQVGSAYAIREVGKNGELEVAATRNRYFPIVYREPIAEREQLLGLDMLSDPKRSAAIEATIKSKRPRASGPTSLRLQPQIKQHGIFLMQAVYETGIQKTQEPLGVLGAVIPARQYLEKTLGRAGFAAAPFRFEDVSAPSSPLVLVDTLQRIPEQNDYQRQLDLGGRNYLVTFAPGNLALVQHRSWQSWITLAGGLVLTGLLGAFLLLMSGQRLQIERVVIDRTRKLQEREAKLVAILDKAVDAILTINRKGVLVSVNGAAGRLFGYPLNQMQGMPFSKLIQANSNIQGNQILERLSKRMRSQEELVGRYADGRTFPLSVAVSLVEVTNETFFVCILRDLTEQHRAQEKIYQLAHHDPLTGLANRFTLNLQLQKMLDEARETGEKLALMFIDLDHFKKINDIQGHHVGDQLLIEASVRLTQLLPEAAVIARLGNDEFIVVLSEQTSLDRLDDIAQRVIANLREPFEIGGERFQSGASIGISRFPEDGNDPDTLLRNADAAVMAAKLQGRGKHQLFTPELNAAAQERLQMENRIWLALERKEFEVYLQPQVHLASRQIIGAEALLRWRHPELGFIAPDRFIPIAEESGLILPLGEWVLERTLRLLAGWQHLKLANMRIAVNLSARQCHSGTLLTCLDRLQEETRVDLDGLEMEITETAAMQDPEQTRELLRQLRLRGIKVAIDDFGTGYSSLNYLKLFEIDRIKIDRSFVKDIEKDQNDALIASATIALAHTLGLEVIAEGVETEGQCAFLNHELCDEGQGYLFGKPMPVAEFEALISGENSTGSRYA